MRRVASDRWTNYFQTMGQRHMSRFLGHVLCLARRSAYGQYEKRSSVTERLISHHCNLCKDSSHLFRGKILSTSFLLKQDGLDIRELPIIVRHTKGTTIPSVCKTNNSMSEQENEFKTKLQQCSTVKEVLKLLEVPADSVTANSAASALLCLCQLEDHASQMSHDFGCHGIQSSSRGRLDSFLQAAVLHELCENVVKDVSSLTNDTITKLVKCCLKSNSIPEHYKSALYCETETRIGDSAFSINNLCNLISMLHHQGRTLGPSDSDKCGDLLHIALVHLGNRHEDIDDSNIANVYSVLAFTANGHKYLYCEMERQLKRCWWKLKSDDFVTILTSMMKARHMSVPVLNLLGKWAFVNIQNIPEGHLAACITAYIAFDFMSHEFMTSLERYITAKNTNITPNLIALAMEYCNSQRHLSTRIFDTASIHFLHHSDKYNNQELFMTITPFGKLNYTPPSHMTFFPKVEDELLERYTTMKIGHLMEVLTSFVFVKKFPLNITSRIFTFHFLSTLPGEDCKDMRRIGYCLKLLQTSIKLETSYSPRLYYRQHLMFNRPWSGIKQDHFVADIARVLTKLIGPQFHTNRFLEKTPYTMDIAIYTDKYGKTKDVEYSSPDIDFCHKLALVVILPEHCCSNTGHLLGEMATKLRHLKIKDYKTIPIYYQHFHGTSREKTLESFLTKRLGHM